jgi:serine/threonine protein phosphatase PrpC
MTSITIGHATDVGKKRNHNEDAYIALLPPNTPGGVDALLAVADGMGGRQAGEVASNIAVQIIADRFSVKDATLVPGSGNFEDVLRSIVEQANAEIFSQGTGETQGMGTTLTVVLIAKDNLYYGHVGDSRAYIFRDGVLTRITNDHSWVAEEVRAGRLTENEAASHRRRNVITRALGSESSVVVDTGIVRLLPGDCILLSSDGLHAVINDDDIAKMLKNHNSLQPVTNKLIEAALSNGGPDNVTVILAQFPVDHSRALTEVESQTTITAGAISTVTTKTQHPWWKLFGR